MSVTAQQFLDVARKEIGYREGRTAAGTWNNDTKFGRWYGLNFNAWCAMFVSWCAWKVGATDIIPRFAWTPSGAAWFKSRGQYGTTPKVGAIGFVYSSSVGRIYHTFIVEAVHSDGSFTTIEGNTNTSGSAQGDGVYRLRRRVGSAYTFGYPAYQTSPVVNAAKVAKAATSKTHLDAPAHTRRVQKALKAEGLLKGYIPGRFGRSTRRAYEQWQRSKAGGGYRGKDASGVPGKDSLRRLGRRNNFIVT